MSTAAVATSAYSGARARSSAVSWARGAPSSSGRSRAMPTRLYASPADTARWTTGQPAAATDPSSCRVCGSSTAPPPSARTPGHSPSARATAPCSNSRKAASPSSTKMSDTGLPARATTSSSVSRKPVPSRRATSRPTLLFPAPGAPTSTTRGWAGPALTGSPAPSGIPRRCGGSPRSSRRRTSPAPRPQRRGRSSPRRPHPPRARRTRRNAGRWRSPARPW